MDRRELLKFLPAAGGAVFVGHCPSLYHSDRKFSERLFRVVFRMGEYQHDADVEVYDHKTGEKLDWLVQEFSFHASINRPPRVRMKYIQKDETGRLEMSPHGFLIEHAFEGSAV